MYYCVGSGEYDELTRALLAVHLLLSRSLVPLPCAGGGIVLLLHLPVQ